MAKVTSKLQVTIPKALAGEYGIEPGDEIEFEPAGDCIRIRPPGLRRGRRLSLEERLRLFDEGTARQREYEKTLPQPIPTRTERDWKREDLYTRGEPR